MNRLFNKNAVLKYAAVFLTALFVITICSKSSPLYPLNDWDDPNCFFTAGKAMANGRILYRDIFEQKGPLLYMLHEIACMISERSFLGVYFIEILTGSVFLYYSLRIMELFTDKKTIIKLFPFAALTYTSLSFCCGDSAEELCLPLLAYSLFTVLCCIKRDTHIPAEKALVCGICAGIVLWIKFTMLGFFIGFVISLIILYIREKKYKRIGICAASMFTGAVISSVPVIWYFCKNNAFSYLFEVYFYDNMFLYSTGSDLPVVIKQIVNLFSGLISFAGYNTFGFICLIFAFVGIYRQKSRKLEWVFTVIAVCTFIFSFIGGRAYAYYPFAMTVFAPAGIAYIYDLSVKLISRLKVKPEKRTVKAAVCLLSAAVTFLMCRNIYLMFIPKEEMPQYRFNEAISKVENASLLNYGFLDGGFYTVSGIIPDCRYFCQLNVELDEMYEMQRDYAENGKTDFIVTKDEKPEFEKYICIDECSFPYWTEMSRYYLYKRIDEKTLS